MMNVFTNIWETQLCNVCCLCRTNQNHICCLKPLIRFRFIAFASEIFTTPLKPSIAKIMPSVISIPSCFFGRTFPWRVDIHPKQHTRLLNVDLSFVATLSNCLFQDCCTRIETFLARWNQRFCKFSIQRQILGPDGSSFGTLTRPTICTCVVRFNNWVWSSFQQLQKLLHVEVMGWQSDMGTIMLRCLLNCFQISKESHHLANYWTCFWLLCINIYICYSSLFPWNTAVERERWAKFWV